MRVFGTKQVEPTDADRVAAARLSAVAARFKSEETGELTESSPDPIGEPEASADPDAAEPEDSAEPEADE